MITIDEMAEWSRFNPTPGCDHAGFRRIQSEFGCSRSEAEEAARVASGSLDESEVIEESDPDYVRFPKESECCLPSEFSDETIPSKWEDMIKAITSHQEWLKDQEIERSEVEFKIETTVPVILFIRGDGHLGNMFTDHTLWAKHHKLLLKHPAMHELNVGDNWDGAIKTYMADLVQEQVVRTKIQRKLWWVAYRPVARQHKLVALIRGQHDAVWSSDTADFDPLEWFADENGDVNYLGAGGLIKLTVGNQLYKILARHKFSGNSAKNPEHSPREMIRQLNNSVDIAVVADRHVGACAFHYEGGRKYLVVRPSTYKVGDKYAKEGGYAEKPITMPGVILWPDKKRILPFDNIEDAVDVWNAMFA